MTKKSSKPNFLPLNFIIIMVVLSGVLISNGCNDDNSIASEEDNLEGAEVVIKPRDVSFEVDEQHEFSAFVISASGDTVNEEFDLEWTWYSSNPDVFTVQDDGTASGISSGEAYCIVEAETASGNVAAKLRFVGRDSAFVSIF